MTCNLPHEPNDTTKIAMLRDEIERLRYSLRTIADAADFIPADDLRKAARATLTTDEINLIVRELFTENWCVERDGKMLVSGLRTMKEAYDWVYDNMPDMPFHTLARDPTG